MKNAIKGQGLTGRYFSFPSRLFVWLFWVVLVGVLILALVPPTISLPSTGWDKSNHLLAFATLAFLGCYAYPIRAIALAVGLLMYGGLIELLQGLTPYRAAEWADLLADGIGMTIGIMIFKFFSGVLGWFPKFMGKPDGASSRIE